MTLVICWSAARTSSGGSSQPISAALPVSWIHRSTRASFAACSRRSFAFFGAALMTARAIAARSAPGGQPGGPVQHLGLCGAGLIFIQQRGGPADDLRLVPGDRAV